MPNPTRRICLLLTDLEIGGTPTVVRELAIRLQHRSGLHVEVVGLSRPGPLRDQLFAAGVKCTALGAGSVRDLRVLRGFHRLLCQERIDTVLSFLIHANAVAAAVRPLYPRARYLQSIQTTQPSPRWHWALQRFVQGACEVFVVPSPSVAQAAQRWAGIPPEKIAIIPNAVELGELSFHGVDPEPASADDADASERHTDDSAESRSTGVAPVSPRSMGVSPVRPFRIGFIGRLDPVKRIPDLLSAMTHLPAEVRLDLYGEGRERARIESVIALKKLSERVTLHGAIPHPRPALAMMDILVLPSDAEGFGLVLIEAMAAGVPVVATNVPGIRDVVIDGQTGLLVPPRSPRAIAAALRRLMGDGTLRRSLIQGARRDVERRFTWDAVFPQYLRLLGIK